ncbi:MAG: UDP-N-acetylglucosamine 2-epimerase [Merdibacter sp.]
MNAWTADQVFISEPLEVYDFHNIIRHAYLILTDSGGIQEEAPTWATRCSSCAIRPNARKA